MSELKQEAIQHIESISPPDSEYAACAARGQRMINEAIEAHYGDWRELPEAILVSVAQRMVAQEGGKW